MRTNRNHQFNLQNLLIDAFIDTPLAMHPAESYALASGLCRHFELDVSPVDILHAIAMAEQTVDEYFDSLDDRYEWTEEDEAQCGIPF